MQLRRPADAFTFYPRTTNFAPGRDVIPHVGPVFSVTVTREHHERGDGAPRVDHPTYWSTREEAEAHARGVLDASDPRTDPEAATTPADVLDACAHRDAASVAWMVDGAPLWRISVAVAEVHAPLTAADLTDASADQIDATHPAALVARPPRHGARSTSGDYYLGRADDGAGVVAYWRGHSAGAVTYQQRPADADEVAAYEGFVARLPATTARLARLAIDLGGVHGVAVDPRATRAVEAAEAPTLPPGAEELAVAAASAVEDAPDRASADVARACERALSARLRPEDAAAYVRGAAGDVIDCARHAYLSRERRAGRDETAEGIAAAEGSALARVRAILPGYEARA